MRDGYFRGDRWKFPGAGAPTADGRASRALRLHSCLFDPRGGGWLAVQTLEGSFSSVSKPIFATKYSFCSIFRDLQDLQTFAPLQIQNFRDFSIFRKNLQFFRDFAKFSEIIDEILLIFLVWSGAKACKSRRARKMLQNEYLVAKSALIQPRTSRLKFARKG